MRHAFKVVMVTGLVLSLAGFMELTPVQLGKYFSAVAEASEWSEGILAAVNGLSGKEGQAGAIGPIEIRLADGNSFTMDPKVRIRDTKGQPVLWEEITFPSKIRYLLDKGVVKEMVLIEALPR
jgi:hypothetical protein